MAFIGPQDRVLESTTTSGSGAFTLAGAVLGFRPFSAVCAVGDTLHYFVESLDAVGQPTGDYEYGLGTYSATNTLTRTTVLGSSNAGSTVNFAAGTKNVGIGLLASSLAGQLGASGYTKAPNGTITQRGVGSTTSGTGTITFPIAFPNACRQLVAIENTAAGWTTSNLTIYGVASKSNTGATIRSMSWTGGSFAAGGGNFDWIAIGD